MELKDWLNSINQSKINMIDENYGTEKEYPPFIINKCMSGFMDTVLIANEMNIHSDLPKKMQYDFFINIVRPKKRFSPWLRKEKIDTLELVKKYYHYNDEKARSALKILSEEQIEFIKQRMKTGGTNE
jgi:hypothetical protein|tara:strand:- start:1240 stop:1623 length:384 start_codon:yes stop_codon:yes gene_type:complete